MYVGRPTRWGNPFAVGQPHPDPDEHGRPVRDRAEAVDLYRLHLGVLGLLEDVPAEARRELAGKDLACWCPLPAPGQEDVCHAAILLQVANGEPQ